MATSFLGHLRLGIHPVPSLIFLTLDIHHGSRGRSALSRIALARPSQVRSTCAHIGLSMSEDMKKGASQTPRGPRRAEDGAREIGDTIVRSARHTMTTSRLVLADPEWTEVRSLCAWFPMRKGRPACSPVADDRLPCSCRHQHPTAPLVQVPQPFSFRSAFRPPRPR